MLGDCVSFVYHVDARWEFLVYNILQFMSLSITISRRHITNMYFLEIDLRRPPFGRVGVVHN